MARGILRIGSWEVDQEHSVLMSSYFSGCAANHLERSEDRKAYFSIFGLFPRIFEKLKKRSGFTVFVLCIYVYFYMV